MNGIESSLKCRKCYNVPRDVPADCCPSGHIICQKCRWLTINDCPIWGCDEKISDEMTNALADSLIGQVEHRCKFKAQGCEVKMLLKDLETHERDCPENPDEKCVTIKFRGKKNVFQ